MAGKKNVSPSRDRVGMRRVGCAHVLLPPDKEASTRRGNRHRTKKQTPDKETNTRQGNKHPTRKQAPDKEASTQQGNRHLFPAIFRYCRLCCTCWTLISHHFLICSKRWTMMYYTNVHIYFPNSPRNICVQTAIIFRNAPNITCYH